MTIWEERRLASNRRPHDVRSEWERDLARLIHSSAFRRLQSKTQVLGLGESDFYRTRLTHSMEVAQIGSGLLREIQNKYRDDLEKSAVLPDPALMQAICLAHDIGHPPFGHGGEVALNYCMRDFGGFEGNGQTLRILAKLEKYTESHGINPTRRLLLGVLKYPVRYSDLVVNSVYDSPGGKIVVSGGDATGLYIQQRNVGPKWQFKSNRQKPPKCYHDSESDVVDFIFESFSANDIRVLMEFDSKDGKHRKPKYKALDTSIMDLADEISYSLHDLEDAISLGMVTKQKWDDHFQLYEGIFEACHGNDFSDTAESIANELFGASHLRKNCIGKLVHLLISNVELGIQNEVFLNPILKYRAKLPENIENLRSAIFKLVKNEVIDNENVQQLEFKGQKLVVELFDVLATDPERFLPASTKSTYQSKTNETEKMRVICDFVSGMTDDYATRFYEKLFFPRKGSIFDRL